MDQHFSNKALFFCYLDHDEPNNVVHYEEFFNEAFNLEDKQFKKIFRLKKNQVNNFMDIVHNFMPEKNRIISIDDETKVCVLSINHILICKYIYY